MITWNTTGYDKGLKSALQTLQTENDRLINAETKTAIKGVAKQVLKKVRSAQKTTAVRRLYKVVKTRRQKSGSAVFTLVNNFYETHQGRFIPLGDWLLFGTGERSTRAGNYRGRLRGVSEDLKDYGAFLKGVLRELGRVMEQHGAKVVKKI